MSDNNENPLAYLDDPNFVYDPHYAHYRLEISARGRDRVHVKGYYGNVLVYNANLDQEEGWQRESFLKKFAEAIDFDHVISPDQFNKLEREIATWEPGSDNAKRIQPVSAADLIGTHEHLRRPVIGGLLREGEVGNIIAATKVRKSWLVLLVALSKAAGLPLFGQFNMLPGRVLIVDNELHAETLAFRIEAVARALGLTPEDYRDNLHVLSLRGDLLDINELCDWFDGLEPGTYQLVVFDAWYRGQPAGTKENDNGDVMRIYNRLDRTAMKHGCGWLSVHHSSKGAQADKAVTDVGAGAGSQSRAADTHIVLREHEEPGIVVMEGALRSFPPLAPLALKFTFPLWSPADDVDPTKLKGRLTKGEARQTERDSEGMDKVMAILKDAPATATAIRRQTGLGKGRLERLLNQLTSKKVADTRPATIHGNRTHEYFLLNGHSVVQNVVRSSADVDDGGEGGGVVPLPKGQRTTTPSHASPEADYPPTADDEGKEIYPANYERSFDDWNDGKLSGQTNEELSQ